jgi:O-acetyl-ADP-ribose deacetylase (regulator of RNase III)
MNNLQIIEGDITKARVDAIVNAANPTMLGGGGVDGAIHRAAGPKLLQACQKVPAVNGIRCPFGEARITEAGDLPASYVIHTTGPIYLNESDPETVLISAYKNSLQLALDNNCQSIAFPAISCGAYGYPHPKAANIALSTCKTSQFSSLAIYFYLIGPPMVTLWQQCLSELADANH